MRSITGTMDPIVIAIIFILIFSVVIHELAHGYAAYWQGDPTAKLQGRLSANPLVHLDPLMSVIVPGLLILSSAPFVFGAAKPVPYNPYNLRNQRWGELLVAGAGPMVNIAVAILFALIIQSADVLQLSDPFIAIAGVVVAINLFLAFFNLIPIPPLDGSKILPALLPLALRMKYERVRFAMEQNIFLAFFVIIFVFFFILSRPLTIALIYTLSALIGVEPTMLVLDALSGS